MWKTFRNRCLFHSINRSCWDFRRNACYGYANKLYGFVYFCHSLIHTNRSYASYVTCTANIVFWASS
jgi:hypothetical protein